MKLFKIVAGLILSFPVSFFAGYVFSRLWGWFVAPKFGLPQLGVLDSVALLMMFAFAALPAVTNIAMRINSQGDEDQAGDTLIQQLALGLVAYPMTLLLGYIYSQFL